MTKSPTVKRLLDKGKRGFLRGIFSRGSLIIILFLVQILFLISSMLWLDQYRVQLTFLETILRVSSILYLVNSRMDRLSIITWLIVILIFPIFGPTFLLYTKRDWGYRGLKALVQRSIEESKPYYTLDKSVLVDLKNQNSTTYNLAKYLYRSGSFPTYRNTQVTYFPSGESKFEEMKKQLKKAEKFIFLEYFIIDEGVMWGEILTILEEKVAEGVEVRVMYDGMLEFSTLSFDYAKRLQKLGIKARAFAPIRPFVSTYYNYRDHRKILVIDGKIAFNGGVNLADEYINAIERFGHWKDTAIMLEGSAVESFTLMFLQMWSVTSGDYDFSPYKVDYTFEQKTEGFVIPYGDSPLDSDNVGENVYIDILNHARDYVYIMTPYLILDSELEHALKFAAERGVDVRLLMPGIPDKSTPYALAKRYYRTLIDSGVKIYEYSPGFLHAKVFLSDDIKAVVGTINLDYRSLYHHFECATYLYKVSALKDIKQDFEKTLAVCSLVTKEDLKKLPLKTKVVGIVVKLLAPLL